jgi:hypothetical protein
MCDSKRHLLLYLLVAILATAAPLGSVGAEPETTLPRGATPPATASAEPLVILTYEVSDLILDVPDHPYPGAINRNSPFGSATGQGMPAMGGMGSMSGAGGMGGGFMQVRDTMESTATKQSGSAESAAPRPARITLDDLERVLTKVIAPESWSDVGGAGELQHLGTSLVIRQTQAIQDEIQSLLDQLRNGQGKQRTVAIDARWLLLDSEELDQLIPSGGEREPQIDRAKLEEFTRRPTSIRGRTNCFTGQLVYLISGTRRNVVTSFVPVVGSVDSPLERQYASLPGGAGLVAAQVFSSERAVGYQPVISTPNLGVLLQIRPTLIPGGSQAIVDLCSTLTVLGDKPEQDVQVEHSPSEALTPKVDRLAVDTQELATTLSVPLGRPVLVGGLTYIASPSAHVAQKAEKTTSETPQLYLVLELQ